MRRTIIWPVLLCFLLSGCAYIGEPLPPALKIPMAVTDLTAQQRGDKIYVSYTPPALTTEGLVLDPPPRADIRIGVSELPDSPGGNVIYAAPWIGKEVVIGATFRGPSGRVSEWSNLVRLTVIEPVTTPTHLIAENTKSGIQLKWTGSAEEYRILRDEVLLDTVKETSFFDSGAAFDVDYSYEVQGVTKTAESEISAAINVLRKDIYPPSSPDGFIALAGVKTIELSWEPSIDEDVSFYRIYRNGTKLVDNLDGTTFSDPDVQSGHTYRYTISAVDAKMNESEKSAPVEIEFP